MDKSWPFHSLPAVKVWVLFEEFPQETAYKIRLQQQFRSVPLSTDKKNLGKQWADKQSIDSLLDPTLAVNRWPQAGNWFQVISQLVLHGQYTFGDILVNMFRFKNVPKAERKDMK